MSQGSRSLRWLKSKMCTANGNCVEVAEDGDTVFLRSSLRPLGAVLPLARGEFWGFVKDAAAGGFTGLIGEADQMAEERTGDGAAMPRSSPCHEKRRLPRGNGKAAGTARPGVSKPLEGVFSLIIRVRPSGGQADEKVYEVLVSGACAFVISASWRPAVAVPLALVVAAPKLASRLRRVAKSVEGRWG